jgi:hypothetical protein
VADEEDAMNSVFPPRTTSSIAWLASLLSAIALWLSAFATHPAARSRQLAGTGNQQAVVQGDADKDEIGWICPMHPEQTSDSPGKCPRCGMALVRGALFEMRDYRLDFQSVPALPKAGEKLTLKFGVFHPGTGEPIRNFELVHEKPYHLFVISQDMGFFQHIHPVQGEDGRWSIDVVLPKPGAYAVLSDFTPGAGSAQFLTRTIVTAGYKGDLLAQSARLVADGSPAQTIDDLTATTSYDPPILRAGSYGHLTFHLTNASGQPVRDLQTYLGAFGHMLIMSEDMVDYVHSHPAEILSSDLNLEELRGGPDVMFEGLMPKPGRYRAWTQFRYHDKIYTFTNTFTVLDVGQ